MISYEKDGKTIIEVDKGEEFAISYLTGYQVDTLLDMVFQKFKEATGQEEYDLMETHKKLNEMYPVKW